jgi:hypothetical protein
VSLEQALCCEDSARALHAIGGARTVSLELKELRGCSSICCLTSLTSCFACFFFEAGDSGFFEDRDAKRTCRLPTMAAVRVKGTAIGAKRCDARVKVEGGEAVPEGELSARVRSWEPKGRMR